MTRYEHEINKALNCSWLMLALVAVSCAVFKGAWHQIAVAVIALVMYVAMRPKKWAHVPDSIYDDLNRQIEEIVCNMKEGTKTVTVRSEEGDVCVYLSAELSASVSRMKFTDNAWGASKTCTETCFFGLVSVSDVKVTDADGRVVDSDFDRDFIQVEYESSEWE